MNIKELEPTTQSINESIFEEDLSIVVDEFVKLDFKEVNKGKEENIRKKYFFDYINLKIKIQEIYIWLLNNQNDLNSIYLLGYFNYHGIEININMQKAFELYQKATNLGINVAQYNLANMYMDGNGIDKNYEKAFELSKNLADKNYSSGINLLGFCHDCGIGTNGFKQKAFELYQKAADLGNSHGVNNLGWYYENELLTGINIQKAFELYQKAADLENSHGMSNLGRCYEKGIGTDANEQKAFELYQKAANLGNRFAQFNLAFMYEKGNKDKNQAIYWYKKSAKQGYQNAQYKLNHILNE